MTGDILTISVIAPASGSGVTHRAKGECTWIMQYRKWHRNHWAVGMYERQNFMWTATNLILCDCSPAVQLGADILSNTSWTWVPLRTIGLTFWRTP
jgi:hypothetical protein